MAPWHGHGSDAHAACPPARPPADLPLGAERLRLGAAAYDLERSASLHFGSPLCDTDVATDTWLVWGTTGRPEHDTCTQQCSK